MLHCNLNHYYNFTVTFEGFPCLPGPASGYLGGWVAQTLYLHHQGPAFTPGSLYLNPLQRKESSGFGSVHLCMLAAFLDSQHPCPPSSFKLTGREWARLSPGSSALIGLSQLQARLGTNHHDLQDVGL